MWRNFKWYEKSYGVFKNWWCYTDLKIKTLSIGEVLGGGHTSENLKTMVRTFTLQLLSYTFYSIKKLKYNT